MLSATEEVQMVEVLTILGGIAIIWAIYYGYERAELPGEGTVPDPSQLDDTLPDTRGRTL